MKDKTKIGLAVGGLAAALAGAGVYSAVDMSHYVPEGHVGVIEGQFGFAEKPLSEGRHWFVGCDDVLCVLTGNYSMVHNVDVRWKHFDEKIPSVTSDGTEADVDIGVTYRINPEMAASVFQQYDPNDIKEALVQPVVRNAIRDILVDYNSADFGSAEDIEKRKQEIEEKIDTFIDEFGVNGRGVSIDAIVADIELQPVPIGYVEEKVGEN